MQQTLRFSSLCETSVVTKHYTSYNFSHVSAFRKILLPASCISHNGWDQQNSLQSSWLKSSQTCNAVRL